MIKIIIHTWLCFVALLMFTCHASAEEVLSTIEEAVKQYNKGDFDGAANNLEYAAQLVRQKKSDALKEVFPPPLEGWEAEPPTSQATGTAVFGGSVSVSRLYTKKSSTITIDIVSDSPVMQSLIMMLNNPVVAGAGGAKLESFTTHKGIVQYDETNRIGDINIVVDERIMVTVKGAQVAREDLIAYALAIQYSGLEKQ